MSFSKVHSAHISLLKAHIVDVEVDISKGLHSFSIVGLPDKAIEEARDRVSAAIKNSGFKSPKSKNEKVTISLAPADIRKEGSLFDLAIALGYLLATKDIIFDPNKIIFLGELSLDGKIRSIHGTIALVEEAKFRGFESVVVPKENAKEAALVHGITIYGAEALKQVIDHFTTKNNILTKQEETPYQVVLEKRNTMDMSDVRGQETAKRGLEIAAAGGHNVALYGPPGTGKTMLAKTFLSILPPLSFEEMLQITSVHSIAGILRDSLVAEPPFRSPHHTASYTAIVGGGAIPRPGEITLAHRGVLFLDEFPEFERRVIEALRQPLEDKVVAVARARGSAYFPADFVLIAAMNPCPCGNFGFRGKECVCSPLELARYKKKISGPILERIDIWLEVPRIEYEKLSLDNTQGESSTKIRERVINARKTQEKRFGKTITTNGHMTVKELVAYTHLTPDAKTILEQSTKQLLLSPRVYHKIIKVGRTIADLENSEYIEGKHILEAIRYRPKTQ